MNKLIAIAVLAAFGAFTTLPVPAADKKNAPAEKKADKADKAARPLPANGKVDSIDKAAKSVKVGDRVFHVTATTAIKKAGKAATLDDVTVGEDVGISYRESDSGKLELVSLRIGPKPEAKPKDGKKEEKK